MTRTAVEALAEALPNVMSVPDTEYIYGPGVDRLDAPDEWYMSPREMATQILATLRERPDDAANIAAALEGRK